MNEVFYVSSAVAVVSTLVAITGVNAIHSLLYLIVSFLAIALVFFTLGAPVVAALEVIIYAGTIIVLFVFVVMILNLGRESVEQEKRWLRPTTLIGPVLLTAVLLGEVIYLLVRNTSTLSGVEAIQPHELGSALFGPYLLGVELASMVLLAGLIGAYHLGRRYRRDEMEERRDELAE